METKLKKFIESKKKAVYSLYSKANINNWDYSDLSDLTENECYDCGVLDTLLELEEILKCKN